MNPQEQIEAWGDRVTLAIEQLYGRNPRSQSAAASLLSEFIDRLAPQPEVVAAVLGDRRPAIIDRLLELAATENPYVCSAVLGALARLGSTQGLEFAKRAIDSKNPHVREAGIRLFGIAASDAELLKLEPLLDDPHLPASIGAIRAVGRRGWKPALPRLLEILGIRRENTRQSFGQRRPLRLEIAPLLEAIVNLMGEEAIPIFLDIAEHDVSLRSYAARELADIPVTHTAAALAHLLTDQSRTLRIEILKLVHRADYRPALPLVRALLGNEESRLREMALQMVSEWRDEGAVELLERMARYDTNPILRVKSVHILAELGGPTAETVLVELSGDTNPRVRLAVVESLGLRAPSPESFATLCHLERDDLDAHVRSMAGEMLRRGHGNSEISSTAPPPRFETLPISLELISELPALVETLRRWRGSLPGSAGTGSMDEMSALDAALGLVLDTATDVLRKFEG